MMLDRGIWPSSAFRTGSEKNRIKPATAADTAASANTVGHPANM